MTGIGPGIIDAPQDPGPPGDDWEPCDSCGDLWPPDRLSDLARICPRCRSGSWPDAPAREAI